ncbi:MAG: hypothetical protein JNK72_18100 [Myxococcales bacterium]|nr:hypothetical protein [Myxococcales bacterium]
MDSSRPSVPPGTSPRPLTPLVVSVRRPAPPRALTASPVDEGTWGLDESAPRMPRK